MPASQADFEAMFRSWSIDAEPQVNAAFRTIQDQFIKAGRFGAGGMYVHGYEAMSKAFRVEAEKIAVKARLLLAGGPVSDETAALLEAALTRLAAKLVSKQKLPVAAGRSVSEAKFQTDPLEKDFARHIEDVMRDFLHMPTRAGQSPQVTVSSIGPVAIITGNGNTVQQTQNLHLSQFISEVRAALNNAAASDERDDAITTLDIIEHELRKRAPDQTKLSRWTKRLKEVGEKILVGAAVGRLGEFIQYLQHMF